MFEGIGGRQRVVTSSGRRTRQLSRPPLNSSSPSIPGTGREGGRSCFDDDQRRKKRKKNTMRPTEQTNSLAYFSPRSVLPLPSTPPPTAPPSSSPPAAAASASSPVGTTTALPPRSSQWYSSQASFRMLSVMACPRNAAMFARPYSKFRGSRPSLLRRTPLPRGRRRRRPSTSSTTSSTTSPPSSSTASVSRRRSSPTTSPSAAAAATMSPSPT